MKIVSALGLFVDVMARRLICLEFNFLLLKLKVLKSAFGYPNMNGNVLMRKCLFYLARRGVTLGRAIILLLKQRSTDRRPHSLINKRILSQAV